MGKRFIFPLLLTPLSLWALEISAGGGPQRELFRGWINYKGDNVDLKKDLHIKDRTKYFGFLNIRHKAKLWFIPLPDVRFSYLEVKSSGYGKVSKSFTFGFITVNYTDRVYTKFRLNQWDALFYYTPWRKKFAKASWGIGVKVLDFYGYVRSETTGQSDSKSELIPLPYLYADLRGQYKVVRLGVEGKGITAGGNNYFYDLASSLEFFRKFSKHAELTIGVGYRYQKYRVDDVGDVSASVRIKGPFAAASLTLSF